MIYTTKLVTKKYNEPVEFERSLNMAIDKFQVDDLEVEVQFAPYRASDNFDYCALVIARRP